VAGLNANEQSSWFDPETGLLDRRVFSNADIYQRELSHIFARAWNFVAHESQVAEAGQYFMSYIGEDEVIVVRDRAGEIQVLLNSCAHRGNTVCRAELGKTRSFLCSYHGWNFDLDGSLIGMPGEDEFYRRDLDKSEWGLNHAAQVESYRGFIFATMDPAAPPLEEYLGWVGRLGLDMLASKGELEVVDGIHKNRIQCNWKLAVDNLYDWYHVKVSHGSAFRLNLMDDVSMSQLQQKVMLGAYGHGIGGPHLTAEEFARLTQRVQEQHGDPEWFDYQASWRVDENVQEELGPVGKLSMGHPNIFPNLWVALTHQVCLRIPRGPLETELWWITLLPKDMDEASRRSAIYGANHFFGPAGFLEQDDGENWSHSTRGAKGEVTKRRPVNLSMGLGQDQMTHDVSGQMSIDSVVSEHGQRWTYENWQAWLQSESWDELKRLKPAIPQGVV